MKAYIDAFITPVPKKSAAVYARMSRLTGKIWLEHGALEYRECMADDAPVGKRTSFPRHERSAADALYESQEFAL